MTVQVEVCVTSVAEARAAAQVGVEHIELCSWPACGGVTPSMGLAKELLQLVPTPLRVLVRPLSDRFQHSREEAEVLLRDIQEFATLNVGVVSGGSDHGSMPDEPLIERIMQVAQAAELTFHRAIDRSPDILQALAICLAHRIPRVLSSGGADSALQGVRTLRRMVELAGNKTLIAAGGGITPENVVAVVEGSGVREVHFLAQRVVRPVAQGRSQASIRPGSASGTEPDIAKIEGVLNALVKAGLR